MARTSKQVIDLVKLLREMSRVAYKCSENFEDSGDKVLADRLFTEAATYDKIIDLLEDKSYYSEIRDIYFPRF